MSNSLHSPQVAHSAPPKERLTATSVFLSFLLVLSLISLGQRGLIDLNRYYNNHWRVCNTNTAQFLLSAGDSCPIEQYAFKAVLLHSYISFPLFIIFLIVALYLRKRRLTTWQKAMFRVSGVVSVFFGIEFLLEVSIYLFQYHRTIGWYFTLGTLAILLIIFVVILERRQATKKANGHH